MLDEAKLRRSEFREGPAIRLADGQEWTLPRPPDRDAWRALDDSEVNRSDPFPFGSDYPAILHACLEAEDEAERLRSELSLAILLLSHNYCLRSSEYLSLLAYPSNHPALGALQRALRDVATVHLRSYLDRRGPSPSQSKLSDRAARTPGDSHNADSPLPPFYPSLGQSGPD